VSDLIDKGRRNKAIIIMGLAGLISVCFYFQNNSMGISATVSPIFLSLDSFDFGTIFLGGEMILPLTVYYSKESGREDFSYNLVENGDGLLCQFLAEMPLEEGDLLGPSDPSDSWNLLLSAPDYLLMEDIYSCDISIEITEHAREYPVYAAGTAVITQNIENPEGESEQEYDDQEENQDLQFVFPETSFFVSRQEYPSGYPLTDPSENLDENNALFSEDDIKPIELEPLMPADVEKYLNQRNLYVFMVLTALVSIASYLISRAIRREDQ
jgi:hypothetical protein